MKNPTPLEELADALQTAVLLVSQLETEQSVLRQAIERAAHALVTMKPKDRRS